MILDITTLNVDRRHAERRNYAAIKTCFFNSSEKEHEPSSSSGFDDP
jgi:hypothetical protein